MKMTMRKAFKEWLKLNKEEGNHRIYHIPIWFSIEIRKRCDYLYCRNGVVVEKRVSGGIYSIEVTEDILKQIKRPEHNPKEFKK